MAQRRKSEIYLFVSQSILLGRTVTTSARSPFVSNAAFARVRTFTGIKRQRAKIHMVASVESLNLPPILSKYVKSFAAVTDPKIRYQQLLFLAKELPPMDKSLQTEENRVHGCTSVVFVKVTLDDSGNVQLQGDSDSQLTKGLLALLVNGLAGVPPSVVANVDPQFVKVSGLATSLTPSRNNGFASMLAKIKKDVTLLASGSATDSPQESSTVDQQNEDSGKPVYSAILKKLGVLKPTTLNVIDNSAAHAGHAGAIGYNGESHFAISVVTDAFEGLSVVQRHRVVYTLLNEELSNGWIHALQIDARAPSEV